MSAQPIPLAAGASINVTGNSIDGFNATAAGTLTISRATPNAPAVKVPVQVGWNAFSQPISQHANAGAALVSSDTAAGTLNVVGPPGGAISSTPVAGTVAQLPAAATTPKGTRATVSDASVTYITANMGSVVAGGGTNTVPVYNNGANWVIG